MRTDQQSKNHLIETASHATGSLLIWDTGEYEILPRRSKHAPEIDPDSARSSESELEDGLKKDDLVSEPEKLATAFKSRKVNIRLHGTRLPKGYTLRLRLTKEEDRAEQPRAPAFKRRKTKSWDLKKKPELDETSSSSDAESNTENTRKSERHGSRDLDLTVVPSQVPHSSTSNTTTDSALEKELQEQEDEEIRRTNAYPGATNSIGSIHQRKWMLSMDREASGFVRTGKGPWQRSRGPDGEKLGFEPFFVLGRDVETSIVTGRTAREVLRDEGVVGFKGRMGWRGVVGGIGAGSVLGMLGYMGWRYGVKGGKFEEDNKL